jgi:urease accessory protein
VLCSVGLSARLLLIGINSSATNSECASDHGRCLRRLAVIREWGGSTMSQVRPAVRALAGLALCTIAGTAAAHPGHDVAFSAWSGFAHPWGGLDHLLAMLGVGVLAALRGGATRWRLPLAFLAMTAAGAGWVALGGAVPGVETGIALSVLAIGGLIAGSRALREGALLALVAGFAIFHGAAHAAEMPAAAVLLGYGSGFLVSTALLHGLGLAIGAGLMALPARVAPLRVALGGAMALTGLAMLLV